jgi:hypothetical protein
MQRTSRRFLTPLVGCASLAVAFGAIGTGPASAGVAPCFTQIPPFHGNPQWGFHTGPPLTAKNGRYARGLGNVNLSTGSIGGTVCQVNVVGGVDRLLVLKPTGRVIYHTHHATLGGHLGNLMEVDLKVSSSTDKKCATGAIGRMTVEATYNGVEDSTVEFVFHGGCASHSHVYRSSQVAALVPAS